MISIDEVFNKYKDMLERKGILAVIEPFRTVIAIYTIQGILDNGGFEYLFENEFNDKMPIYVFRKSYENIGANEMGKLLAKANGRKNNLQELRLLDDEMFQLSSEVWKKLDSFMDKNGIVKDDMEKYTEFAFIRNTLYQKNYTKELESYIDEIAQTISKKSKLEIFILDIIGLAKNEIDKENYTVASYLFGLIHNLPKNSAKFDEQQFFEYDFLSFYEHMLDNNRLDILKTVMQKVTQQFIT